jgi:dihydrofolate reductase
MRKIVAVAHMTLDGILSGPQGDEDNMISWAMPGVQDSTPDFLATFAEFDTILLGRVTYEGLAQFWPTATGEFADRMNLTPKLVFSQGSLDKVAWGAFDNITLIKDNVAGEMQQRKAQPGKDMVIFASSKLIQSFTNAGLVDEYRLIVHPVLLGSGKRLFDNLLNRSNLTLLDAKPYPSGAALMRYAAVTAA